MTPANLREFRVFYRLTRPQLAEMLDCTATTIYRWETGRTRLPGTLEGDLLDLTHSLQAAPALLVGVKGVLIIPMGRKRLYEITYEDGRRAGPFTYRDAPREVRQRIYGIFTQINNEVLADEH